MRLDNELRQERGEQVWSKQRRRRTCSADPEIRFNGACLCHRYLAPGYKASNRNSQHVVKKYVSTQLFNVDVETVAK